MKIETFERYFLYRQRYVIAYVILIALTLFAMFYKLGNNPVGVARAELEYFMSSNSLEKILEDAINLPHKLLTLLSVTVLGGSAFALRLPSVIYGIIFALAVFATFSIWHRKRIAITATFLAVSSSWFLNISRLGTDYVALPTVTMLLVLLMAYIWHSKTNYWHMISFIALLGFSLYTPLIIYFFLLFLILYRKEINQKISLFKKREIIFGAVLMIGILSPLIYTIYLDSSKIFALLGLENGLPTFNEFLDNVKFVFSYIFWSSNENALLHIAKLPMLDIFTATMAALGLYHYERHTELLRTRFALWGLLMALVLASATGREEHVILSWPFILIFAATGVITLLTQWYKIFPNNPVARVFAIFPLALLIIMSVNYNLNRFFVAWPNQEGIYEIYEASGEVLREKDTSSHSVLAPDRILDSVRLARYGMKPLMPVDTADYVYISSHSSTEELSNIELEEIEKIDHPIINEPLFTLYKINR